MFRMHPELIFFPLIKKNASVIYNFLFQVSAKTAYLIYVNMVAYTIMILSQELSFHKLCLSVSHTPRVFLPLHSIHMI